MIINQQLAASTGHLNKDLWATPDHIFKPLMEEFKFTLDPCCVPETAKCSRFFTPETNGLHQDWGGHNVFVNPPYSRGNIDLWVKKCYEESALALVVGLLPVSTSSTWFHDWVYGKAELRFYKVRIKFVGAPYNAPFSSMLAIWR